MENMRIYETVRSVPDSAKKEIKAGRLKGMTDINPMWRIKALTEQFGPCGIGWKAVITKQEIIDGSEGQKVAICNVSLYIKTDDVWSEAIEGTGGSMLVSNESRGAYTSDEAYKMAYTDAISVCCKMLGFGADVYWDKDRTKYSAPGEQLVKGPICANCLNEITGVKTKDGQTLSADEVVSRSMNKFGRPLCLKCAIEADKT